MAQEEFHSPKSGTSQGTGYFFRHFFGFFQVCRVDVCRLETLTVVTAFLYVSDRRTEQRRSVFLCNGEQGDFTVEFDEFFDDQFADIATAATASVFPGMFKLVGTLDERLSFAGRRHQRFDDTRETDFGGCFLQFVQGLGIKIVGCFQAEFFGGKVTDRLTVHREVDGTGTGHYLDSFFFKVIETLCADGFYLRNDDVRMMFFDNAFQCFTVQHVEDFKFIGNLHSRCSGIRITSNDVLPLALCRDHKLFS